MSIKKIEKKESIFIKENVNPYKRITGDCVIRAITKATGNDYKSVVMDMARNSAETGFSMGSNENIEAYLSANGFRPVKLKAPKKGESRPKVRDIAALSVEKPIVCRVANHLTACVGSKLYDLWDCSEKAVYGYYIKD